MSNPLGGGLVVPFDPSTEGFMFFGLESSRIRGFGGDSDRDQIPLRPLRPLRFCAGLALSVPPTRS